MSKRIVATVLGVGLVSAGIAAGMGAAAANPLCPNNPDPMAGCSVPGPPDNSGNWMLDKNTGQWKPTQPGITNPTIDESGQLPNGGDGF